MDEDREAGRSSSRRSQSARAELAASRAIVPPTRKGVAADAASNATDREDGSHYRNVDVDDRSREAHRDVHGEGAAERDSPTTIDAIVAAGANWWPLAMARELDDAILYDAHQRTRDRHVGLEDRRRCGSGARRRRHARWQHGDHWFVRETIGLLRRTLARLDVSSRSLFALIEQGSCFAGTLAELAFAADRTYMLALPDDADREPRIQLTRSNFGALSDGRRISRVSAAVSTRRAAPLDAVRATIGKALTPRKPTRSVS